MARGSSTRSSKTKKAETEATKDAEVRPESTEADTSEPSPDAVAAAESPVEDAAESSDTPTEEAPSADGSETEASTEEAAVDDTVSDTADTSAGDDAADAAAEAPVEEATPEPAPAPTSLPPTEAARTGMMPLFVGGAVAVAVGYGAAFMGLLPVPSDTGGVEAVETAVEAQSEAIAALQANIETLAAAEAPAAPEVDLSPVLAEISAISEQLDSSISALADRVSALEARPVFSGEVDADNAAMAAAVEQLQDQLREQEARNAEMAEELRGAAEAAQAGIAQAQDAIAEAEARAQESVAAATAQAALSQIRIAMAAGDPFGDALANLPASIEIPAALAAAAETGVPTLADLQVQFPAAARAALPVAIRETAGDSATDRLGAFLRGQIGGRSIEPREGDDPDAVLSRAQAAVTSGDLTTALAEIAALPDGAQAEMAAWVAAANDRQGADSALDTLAAALGSGN